MKHPAENFLKYLLIRDRGATDAQVLKTLDDWGFLSPQEHYLQFLRRDIGTPPADFDPGNKLHRPSMKYLRDLQIYELFFPTPGVEEAWANLSDPSRRMVVEQVLLARLELKMAATRINKKYNWRLTEEGFQAHGHFFWNVKLLTFDQWGRYLYDRSALYDSYMALLRAPPQLAFFHLRLDQVLESKKMIQHTQEIAYKALLEVDLMPGVRTDKVKAINMLGKTITDCHNSLSTSDMALSTVLKEFEKFRMTHPQLPAPSIRELAPAGNYTGSGVEDEPAEKDKVH